VPFLHSESDVPTKGRWAGHHERREATVISVMPTSKETEC
jgi:hypothetical protein